ncbi:unnamed protein product, partial [Meganyctiphanes norvegica]
MVAPDAELPGSSDAPPNWQLDPAVIAWANLIIDSCDWSPEDRKALQVQFNPVPDLAHLFDAVHMPPELITCFKHKSTVSSDYIFNRFSAETFLYNANLDMVTAYRPLLEIISSLKGCPGQENNRFLLGRVFQRMVSSTVKVSRGRRELARRFVPLANATALYKTKPSHKCIFGGESTDAAVTQGVADSKQNKSLAIIPKTFKQPFRASGYSGKGFPSYRYPYQKSQFYDRPRPYQQARSYQKSRYYEDSYEKRGYNRSRAGRQKGRGGRGKNRQSRSSNSKNYF